MTVCYICKQEETLDEKVVSEFHQTVFTLCRRCMVDIVMTMDIERKRWESQ